MNAPLAPCVQAPADRQVHQDDLQHVATAIPLVRALCSLLRSENIRYCHWKSNNAIDRSASGDNDLDLLVARADATRFQESLARLGFKPAQAPTDKRIPGVVDYFGCDGVAGGKLVHVHAHFRLVCGHDMTKNVRLPIEEAYIASSVPAGLFRVPIPELEYIVLVVRLVLKHRTWDGLLCGEGRLKAAERRELAYLEERIDSGRVVELLNRHLPWIDGALFTACRRSLDTDASAWAAVRSGRRLQARLSGSSRLPPGTATLVKLWRRGTIAVRRRMGGVPRYRIQTGGAIIALVGGDGSGKSTAIDGLRSWLSTVFETHAMHLGKPEWSATTVAIRSVLKIGQLFGLYPLEASMEETLSQRSAVSPGYPWLVREVCLARDRYRVYRRAQRLAARGALVLLDRLPLPQIRLMEGARTAEFVRQLRTSGQTGGYLQPHASGWLVRLLVRLEQGYYQRITVPDVIAVLRVDPQIAARRKTEDDPAWVVRRTTEIWNVNWEPTGVHVVNANLPRDQVLAQLQALVWAKL